MIVKIVANTDGKGLWTEDARPVHIHKLDIGYSSLVYYPEEPFHGELRAYFDPHGFAAGSWHTGAYGLVYTDKLWMKEFKAELRRIGFSIKAVQGVSYSEQGMQGEDYVSMDINAAFYGSWKRLEAMEAKERESSELEREMGI